MKISCVLILTSGLLVAADRPGKDDPPKGDLDKLRGTWLTVSLVNDGRMLVDEKVPPKEGQPRSSRTTGTSGWSRWGDKTVATGTIEIDSTKTPKEIDVMDESGMKNGKTQLCIYELDVETYKYCVAPAGKPRPTEFTSKVGSGHSL